jgi:hypothetical protein
MKMKLSYLYFLAALLLAGLGTYYFLFERTSGGYNWAILLAAAVFNTYLGLQTRKQEH